MPLLLLFLVRVLRVPPPPLLPWPTHLLVPFPLRSLPPAATETLSTLTPDRRVPILLRPSPTALVTTYSFAAPQPTAGSLPIHCSMVCRCRDREDEKSHKEHFELKTGRHGELFSLMHHVVTGDDPEVKAGKPRPDIFLTALRRFQGSVNPCQVLVFEDSPSGVTAAKSAGMHVVMVPDGRLDASFRWGADRVLGSLLDFDPAMWGLPPFQDVQEQ